MPRSSLMRFVQSLARNQARAEHFGVDPVELREASLRRRASRRDVLKGAAAIGAGVVGLGATQHTRATEQPEIAIVGAGIAGLTAALALADRGYVSTIYEASDRIGGRMHSETSYWDYSSYSPVSEYCGELIDSDHDRIFALAKRFELTLDDLLAAEPSGSTQTFYLQAAPNSSAYGYYSFAEATTDFAPVYKAAKKDLQQAGYPTLWNHYNSYGQMLDSMSVYEWIDARVPGGIVSPMGRLLNVAYDEEYGALTSDQSALNIVYLLAYQPVPNQFSIYGTSDERYHIRGGNALLPQMIAAHLTEKKHVEIKTGFRLEAVSQSDAKVRLDFFHNGAGRRVFADQAILALPFSVLRRLDTSGAEFDDRKKMAINELGSGRNAKLILQYASRFWNEQGPAGVSTGDVYTDLGFEYFTGAPPYEDVGPQNTWDTSRAQQGPYGLLTNYTGGHAATAFHPAAPYSSAPDPIVRRYAEKFADELQAVFPNSAPLWNGKAILSVPFLDPNLLLSYAYWRVGQYTAFAGYERVAQGAIHFAGEHCSVNFQGFMEGGAEEGYRAGIEVVDAITGA